MTLVVPSADDDSWTIGTAKELRLVQFAPNEFAASTVTRPTPEVIYYRLDLKNHTMGYMKDSSKCSQVDIGVVHKTNQPFRQQFGDHLSHDKNAEQPPGYSDIAGLVDFGDHKRPRIEHVSSPESRDDTVVVPWCIA